MHVGYDENEFGMFYETVRQFLESLAYVFDADLFADNQPRDMGECLVHFPKKLAQHGAVTHTGVEDPQSRGPRVDVLEFSSYSSRNRCLLVRGPDKHHVGSPAVKEALGLGRVGSHGRGNASARPSIRNPYRSGAFRRE